MKRDCALKNRLARQVARIRRVFDRRSGVFLRGILDAAAAGHPAIQVRARV